MDDIVKILLGVLFIGFSIYNSIRKKKAKALQLSKKNESNIDSGQSVNNTYAQPKPDYFEEKQDNDLSFFDVIRNEVINYKEENEVRFTNKIEENKEAEIIIDNSVTEFDDKKSHTSLTIDKDDFIDFDELNKKNEEDNIDFDLEKAVIYSEILKPKYF